MGIQTGTADYPRGPHLSPPEPAVPGLPECDPRQEGDEPPAAKSGPET